MRTYDQWLSTDESADDADERDEGPEEDYISEEQDQTYPPEIDVED